MLATLRDLFCHQAFTDAAMASLGEGVYAVDLEGRLTFMNPAAAAILGRTEGELVTFAIRTDTTLRPAEAFGDLVVRSDGSNIVRLKDVARVDEGTEEERSLEVRSPQRRQWQG